MVTWRAVVSTLQSSTLLNYEPFYFRHLGFSIQFMCVLRLKSFWAGQALFLAGSNFADNHRGVHFDEHLLFEA